MKKLTAALLMATALMTPSLASAATVTVTTTIDAYRGPAAYMVLYLTKPDGTYDSTLFVAGRHQRYMGELRGWVRSLRTAKSLSLDGITGASIGSGQTLTLRANIADAMLDAGYKLHIDTAVEHGGIYADDVVVPLTSTPQQASGSGYVSALATTM